MLRFDMNFLYTMINLIVLAFLLKKFFDQACDRHYGKAPSADRRRIEKCPECTGRCDEDEGRICAGTWRGEKKNLCGS